MLNLHEETRKRLLARCQAILDADNFMSATMKQQWISYRDSLQDLNTSGSEPVFPQEPLEPTLPLSSEQVTERSEIAGYLQNISSQYQTAIDRLQQIENAGTVPFTQTGFNQVVQAVKDEAKYIRLIAQAIKRLLT